MHKASGTGPDRLEEQSTPNTDLQPEDAGTADSGNEGTPRAPATPAQSVMKQEHKTAQERGSEGPAKNRDR